MYVAELGDEDRVGPKEVDPARACVARVERHVAHVREVFSQVTTSAPDPENTSGLPTGHVLDGYYATMVPRLDKGSGLPAFQRSAWRRRMSHYYRHVHLLGQLCDPHQRLLRSEPPGAASKRRVERQNRDAVPLDEALQIVLLVGIPAFVHHDLHPVVTCLRNPAIHPFEAECVERAGAEDDGDLHQRAPRRISRNLSSVDGEWFW